jgi:hypothetical protein
MKNLATLLIPVFFLFSNFLIAQTDLLMLTNYTSERKSFEYLNQSEEYILVDDGNQNVHVLTVDSSGQLFTFFESEIPYCISGRTIKISMNNNLLLFYHDDYIIFQNFFTGETWTVDNLPESQGDATAYFVDENFYLISGEYYYLFSIHDNKLFGVYDYIPTVKGNLIISRKIQNSDLTIITHTVTGDSLELDENYRILRTENFDGIFYQRQPRGINEMTSDQYLLFKVNQDGSIDTVNQLLPRLHYADTTQNDSIILMLNNSYSLNDNEWSTLTSIYNFNVKTNILHLIDTIFANEIFFTKFITDSLLLYSNEADNYIINIYDKSKTKIELPEYMIYDYKIQNKLMFLEFNLPVYAYDYKSKKTLQVSNRDILTADNLSTIFKNGKVYYFDINQLQFPLYEVSDTIYEHHQNIALQANQNGLRTSFLAESADYIFSFVDDGIVVLDTTNANGYRQKKVIDFPINLGCFDLGWYEYENVIYGFIPVYNNGNKLYELVSVDLKTLELINLTENSDIITYINSVPEYLAGSGGFIYWGNHLFDIQTKKYYNVQTLLGLTGINHILRYEDKVIIIHSDRMIEMSYPDFSFVSYTDATFQRFIGDHFFVYKKNQGNQNVWISDGYDHIEILNSKDYKIFRGHRFNLPEDAITLLDLKTRKIFIYTVFYANDSKTNISKDYEKSFSQFFNYSERHLDGHICFGAKTDSFELGVLYNLKTKNATELEDINVYSILYIDEDHFAYINRSNRSIEKIDFTGQVFDVLPFPENSEFISTVNEVNKGQNGLYILDVFSNTKYSKLVFDSKKFSFIYDSGCSKESYTRSNQINAVYKDKAYYFNLDLDEKGKQIYKMTNPYDLGTSSTVQAVMENISVFPNPVSNTINIVSSNPCSVFSLQIYDNVGRSLNIPFKTCQTQIFVEHLQQGVYYLEVNEGYKRRFTRFLKI